MIKMAELLRSNPYKKSKIKYEIVCPECASDVKYIMYPSDLTRITEVTCDICGEVFEPTEEDLWVNLFNTDN
jgi:transcription elongation factor Elf1